MLVEETIEAGELVARNVDIAIFAPVEALFLTHKSVRILAELFADFRMLLQVLLQVGTVLEELFVVDQRWIFTKLSGEGRIMLIEELIHAGELTTGDVVLIAAAIFAAVKAPLLTHEGVGILAEFFTDFRMLLQVLLQVSVVLDELLIVDQRGILAELLRELGVAVQETVEIRKLAPGDVGVAGLW